MGMLLVSTLLYLDIIYNNQKPPSIIESIIVIEEFRNIPTLHISFL